MGGIPEDLIAGGQGRSGADVLGYAGIFGAALVLAALVILPSFPTEPSVRQPLSGGSVSCDHLATAPAPHVNPLDAKHGAGASFWSE
jgi:hypothetical protein